MTSCLTPMRAVALTTALLASLTACHRGAVKEDTLPTTTASAETPTGVDGGPPFDRSTVQSHPRLAGHFDEIDADHDGQLTRAEIRAWRQARGDGAGIGAGAASAAMAAHGPARADTNGDGLLDRQEAARFPRMAAHFDEIDTNHDGRLSREEIQQARRNGLLGERRAGHGNVEGSADE